MADLSGMFGTIDSALGQATPVAPPDTAVAPAPGIRFAGPSDPAPSTLPAPGSAPAAPAPQPPSSTQQTISAIDAALAAPQSWSSNEPTTDHEITVHPASSKSIPLSQVPADVANSGVSGVESGFLGLLTLPRTIRDAASQGENYLIGKVADMTGALPPGKTGSELTSDLNNLDSAFATDKLDHILLPSYDDAKGAVEKVGGGQLYQPQSIPGEFAHTIGEFIPGGGEGGLITHVVIPAVASETAGQLTKGTGLEPYARVAGGIVGGAAGAAALGTKEAAALGAQALKDYRLPATVEGQQALAAQKLADAASDPAAVTASLNSQPNQTLARSIIQPAPPNYEVLLGSKPTTVQATGDLGLAQLERKLRTTNPEPFIARDQSQNAVRSAAINDLQATGSPADVATQFRQMRDALDQQGQERINALAPAAADANAVMGGTGTADSTGAALRQSLTAARAATKENEDQLWGLVNQDAGVPAAGIANAAQEIKNSITPSAAPLTGEEARIFDVAAGYPKMQRFGDVKDLRSSITDATAEARLTGNTQTVRRLTMLRMALDGALDHGVENQAALEDIAMRRGQMAPEETLEAQVASLRQKWAQDIERARVDASGSPARTGTVARGFSSGGTSSDAGQVGTVRQTSRGAGQATRDPGVPEVADAPSVRPSFTVEDVANYRAATAATKARASIFDEGPVGNVLRPAPRGGYDMPNASVPDALVPKGKPTDAQVVRQYVAAGGDPEALSDATAYLIRKKASLGDGTLDPGKVHNWLRTNAEALAEMPPEVANRFRTAATAQEAVNAATAARNQRLAAFDKSAIARVAGLTDGEDVVKTIASIFGQSDPVAKMRQLAKAASADPAAAAGLRRALVEMMQKKLLTNSTVNASGVHQIKSDSFLGFLRQNGAALRQVFQPKELDTMAAIGVDLDRANRINQTKGVKFSPGSAQDLIASRDDRSILTNMILEAGPAVAGKALGGWPGAALGWLGAKTIGRGRAAGLANIDDLVTKAMLDPALAKALLAKLPKQSGEGTAASLAHQFARLATATATGTYASSVR